MQKLTVVAKDQDIITKKKPKENPTEGIYLKYIVSISFAITLHNLNIGKMRMNRDHIDHIRRVNARKEIMILAKKIVKLNFHTFTKK